MNTQLFHLHALSALHIGTGQAAGAVDLPIARSRATHLPLVPGSGIKGVLRHAFNESAAQGSVNALFGPEEISASDSAASGALTVGDAHLLLLPVRALAGIMAWVTCPFVLQRYRDDLLRCGATAPALAPSPANQSAWVTASPANLAASRDNDPAPKLILEDLDLKADKQHAQAWAALIAKAVHPGDETAQADLIARFAIVEDDTFSFLADTATEIRTRVRIDPKSRTVADGALWTEENLPAETVLWGVCAVGAARGKRAGLESADDMQEKWTSGLTELSANQQAPLLQMGGKATVGRGLVRWLA
jgi:CRISPR-associated protein Cmr4